jgi:hypothetical protein
VPPQHLVVPPARGHPGAVRADGLIGVGERVRHHPAAVGVGGEGFGEAPGGSDEPGPRVLRHQADDPDRPGQPFQVPGPVEGVEAGHHGALGVADVVQPGRRDQHVPVDLQGSGELGGPRGDSRRVPPAVAQRGQQLVRQLLGGVGKRRQSYAHG